MNNIEKYIDANGNFTHTKIEGTKDQISELIQKYRETNFYKSMTDRQKILAENYLFPEIIETGMVPQGMLLELVMPSTKEKFKSLSELKPGATITFSLPPKYNPIGVK